MGLFRKKDGGDFKSLSTQRRAEEDERPWFERDDDAPELDVETGIGSNLRQSDRRRRD